MSTGQERRRPSIALRRPRYGRLSNKSEWNRGKAASGLKGRGRFLLSFEKAEPQKGAGGSFQAERNIGGIHLNQPQQPLLFTEGGSGVFDNIRYDVRAICERDPAARSKVEVFLLYSGLHAVMAYRLSHWLFRHRRFLIARWISQFAKFTTGIEIHPGAQIGKGLFIDHGTGVVIGETTEIGENCTLYQGVTLGGTGKDKGKRHPTLGDNVMVGAGAKILGPFRVGDNSKVGANALVLSEVPPDSTAVGVPARVIRVNGRRVGKGSDLDQIHLPDPVSQEICKLYLKIDELEREIETLRKGEDKNP